MYIKTIKNHQSISRFLGKNNLSFDGIHQTVQGDSLLAKLVVKAIR
jgi:hypothetical protein